MGAGDMSRDRIKFFVPMSRFDDYQYRRLLTECFGIRENEMPRYKKGSYDKFEIICRPAQFGRFVVLRNTRGIQNLISELDPVIISPPPPVKQPLEVWDRPNTVRVG